MIAVCGEALIDLVDDGDGLFRAHPGGSPANVAVGLSRLEIPVALIARVSQDAFGRLLRAHLIDNGVDLRYLVTAAELSTLAVVSLDGAGVASYAFYANGTADWQWESGQLPAALPAEVVALHSGSLALSIEPAASMVTELLRSERARGQVTISLDPNVRPAFEDDQAAARRRVERQVGLADVVKASAEDLAWLAPGESPSHVARRWQELGPKIVIVTLGETGALAVGPNGQEINRSSPPVELVDTVGAGDAFTAGLLAAMERNELLGAPNRSALAALSAETLATVIDEAALVAAITCSRRGADSPTRDQVRAYDRNRSKRPDTPPSPAAGPLARAE